MYSTDRPVSAEMRKLHYTCCIINRVETVMPPSTLPRASVRYQAKNTLRSPAIKRHGGRICLTAFMQPVKRSRLPCLFCFLYLFVCISLFLYLFVFCVSFVSVSLLICFVFRVPLFCFSEKALFGMEDAADLTVAAEHCDAVSRHEDCIRLCRLLPDPVSFDQKHHQIVVLL